MEGTTSRALSSSLFKLILSSTFFLGGGGAGNKFSSLGNFSFFNNILLNIPFFFISKIGKKFYKITMFLHIGSSK
jgi:hypothetical protein